MKIQRFNFKNNEIIQIYINKTERRNSKVIEQINNLKKQISNISILIGGENETIKIIKEMMNYEKSKNKR